MENPQEFTICRFCLESSEELGDQNQWLRPCNCTNPICRQCFETYVTKYKKTKCKACGAPFRADDGSEVSVLIENSIGDDGIVAKINAAKCVDFAIWLIIFNFYAVYLLVVLRDIADQNSPRQYQIALFAYLPYYVLKITWLCVHSGVIWEGISRRDLVRHVNIAMIFIDSIAFIVSLPVFYYTGMNLYGWITTVFNLPFAILVARRAQYLQDLFARRQ